MLIDGKVRKCMVAEEAVLGGKRPLSENIIVALYELGRVARNYIYSGGSIEKRELGSWAAESITELQDVICQALILIEKFKPYTESQQYFTVQENILSGLDRQLFRMSEVVKGGGGTPKLI